MTFFTPSFAGDLERFVLLRKSMEKFYTGSAKHIVAVPKEDLRLFQSRVPANDDLTYITQNELVDRSFYPRWWYPHLTRVLPDQAWRFDRYGGRSGWILQIIVKLSVVNVIPTGVVALLDSDLFFIRPFSDRDLGDPEHQHLLVRIVPTVESARHRDHVKHSRQILGIPPGSTDHHYMSSPNVWYPDYVKALQNYLENKYKENWQQVLLRAEKISAYTLYGTFLDEVLSPPELIRRDKSFYQIVWDEKSLGDFISGKFPIDDESLCIVVQSNIGVPAERYTKRIEELWGVTSPPYGATAPGLVAGARRRHDAP
ncbi:MAG: hypothetical protein IH627_08245 [Rubrivivax sp.]|nr:hypothetical protein [Rubrivivax sp.]